MALTTAQQSKSPGILADSGMLLTLHPSDLLHVSGVGRVVKNGPGASKFKEGQRVVAVQWPQFAEGGSWTTHAVLPEDILVSCVYRVMGLRW